MDESYEERSILNERQNFSTEQFSEASLENLLVESAKVLSVQSAEDSCLPHRATSELPGTDELFIRQQFLYDDDNQENATPPKTQKNAGRRKPNKVEKKKLTSKKRKLHIAVTLLVKPPEPVEPILEKNFDKRLITEIADINRQQRFTSSLSLEEMETLHQCLITYLYYKASPIMYQSEILSLTTHSVMNAIAMWQSQENETLQSFELWTEISSEMYPRRHLVCRQV